VLLPLFLHLFGGAVDNERWVRSAERPQEEARTAET
jgi:hypothetical protein